MATPSLTPEQKREAVEAVEKHGSVVAAAEALGLNESTLRHRYRQGVKAGLDDKIVQPAPQGHTVKGVSTLYDSAGNISMQWVKTKAGELDFEQITDAIADALASFRGAALPTLLAGDTDSDTLTVYPLVDWHVGLLAWAEETGENYDLAIARDTILGVMGRLIAASPPSKRAVVLGLGDLLHFDGYEPVTSRSRNFLDADGRYPKVLKTATEMVMATIDLALQRHEHVTVRILAGNHDDQSAVAVSLALSLFYEDHERVTVDASPSRFWWFRFGKVFLGATHGDKAKMRDMPLLMAHDRPHDWAASSYRKVYTGHIHHDRELEEGGVIVTSMRTPVAKDAYHSFERYRAGRSVYSESFRSDGSEAATIKFNL
jgi:transposase-like protein